MEAKTHMSLLTGHNTLPLLGALLDVQKYTFGAVTRRHAGLANMAFVDGPVESHTMRD